MLGARQQSGFRIALGEVEPPLLERAAVGTIDGFEGKGRGARQRVLLDPDRIVDAVEFDRLPERRVDDPGIAFNSCFDAADVFEAIERPDDLRGLLGRTHRRPAHDKQHASAPTVLLRIMAVFSFNLLDSLRHFGACLSAFPCIS